MSGVKEICDLLEIEHNKNPEYFSNNKEEYYNVVDKFLYDNKNNEKMNKCISMFEPKIREYNDTKNQIINDDEEKSILDEYVKSKMQKINIY
jgi:hypothetical protein